MFKRIITHNDFDGVISAAICSHALGIDFIVFTGPRSVSEARISITSEDVVCDLPYPLECGMWFDHHEGNLEELQYRKIDPATIEGRFDSRDSCARVVYEYFANQNLPPHFAEMADEADIIDTFNFKSVADWRTETAAKIIDGSIKLQGEDNESKWQFLRSLIAQLKSKSLAEVAATPGVRKRYDAFAEEELQMLEQIERDVSFLPNDAEKNLIILDLTRHNRRPNVLKHLAYLLHPTSLAVLEIKNMFRNNVKSNDLALSMSLSLHMNSMEHHKDIGDIMRVLNIGSGHPGAGAGTVGCRSKDEMMRTKERLLQQIYKMFIEQ